MLLLVSDANILIDIEIGGLTAFVFSLNYQFITPDILYYEELEEYHPHLLAMGLVVKEMNDHLIVKVMNLIQRYPKASRNDIFCLVLAANEGCPLLSGDKALRTAASHERVDCKGTVWLLEELLLQEKITANIAREAVKKMKIKRSRLPWDEIEKIISRFE